MKKTLLAAAIVLGFGGPASALPAASTPITAIAAHSQALQLVKMKRHGKGHHSRRHWNHRRHWNRPHFGRYDRYRGWRRYHARPYRWRERGCAVVGPLWFCP